VKALRYSKFHRQTNLNVNVGSSTKRVETDLIHRGGRAESLRVRNYVSRSFLVLTFLSHLYPSTSETRNSQVVHFLDPTWESWSNCCPYSSYFNSSSTQAASNLTMFTKLHIALCLGEGCTSKTKSNQYYKAQLCDKLRTFSFLQTGRLAECLAEFMHWISTQAVDCWKQKAIGKHSIYTTAQSCDLRVMHEKVYLFQSCSSGQVHVLQRRNSKESQEKVDARLSFGAINICSSLYDKRAHRSLVYIRLADEFSRSCVMFF